MRALVLLIGILGGLGMTVRYPYAGVLLWSWFTLQQPHREAYGFIRWTPLNVAIAIVTLGAWFLSRERKTPATGFIFWMLVVFLVWMTFNSFFAFDTSWSWPYWDRTWKTLVLALLIAATATSRVRIHALLWICVLSLFYYGVKGGLFTIMTGGFYHVVGPGGTIIADNNQLALALLMSLPLALYLRAQSENKLVANGLLAGIGLTVISILGSYSRGAYIGLAALGMFMLWRAKNRFVYLGVIAVVALFALNFMPQHFFDRIDTIQHAQQDESFTGRLDAWYVAYRYATDHFPFGAGFYGPQLAALYHQYLPNDTPHAAHSIYFQVLGEHGFIGLAIYLIILAAAFLRCSKIVSVTRNVPERRWAHDLAVAIQASLFVFCVGGAALSMAYYDLFIMEVALLLPLREIILLDAKEKRPAWSPPRQAVPQEAV